MRPPPADAFGRKYTHALNCYYSPGFISYVPSGTQYGRPSPWLSESLGCVWLTLTLTCSSTLSSLSDHLSNIQTHISIYTECTSVGSVRKRAMNTNNSIISNLYLIENSSLFNNSRLMAFRSNQIGSISDDFAVSWKQLLLISNSARIDNLLSK